jgi:hypothetical protein
MIGVSFERSSKRYKKLMEETPFRFSMSLSSGLGQELGYDRIVVGHFGGSGMVARVLKVATGRYAHVLKSIR